MPSRKTFDGLCWQWLCQACVFHSEQLLSAQLPWIQNIQAMLLHPTILKSPNAYLSYHNIDIKNCNYK